MTENTMPCLLCGASAVLRHTKFPGYREPDTFSIYHCEKCKTAFPLPRVDAGSIYDLIYANAEKVPGYNRYLNYAGIVGKIKKPFRYLASASEAYWGVREALERYGANRKDLKIIEIGSGLGYLTYSLHKEGYDVRGIDISATAVNNARKRFGDLYTRSDIKEFSATNNSAFDFVISTEVIEHVEEPVGFVRDMMSLLKPGGKAIITTPNKSFYPDEIIWASDLPPVHIWWFSEESVRFIADRLGASAEFIGFRGFYRNNYKVVGLRSQHSGKLPSPFFDAGGKLISGAGRKKSGIKNLLLRIPSGLKILNLFNRYFRLSAGKFREHTEKDILTCDDRGVILCAVLEKIK